MVIQTRRKKSYLPVRRRTDGNSAFSTVYPFGKRDAYDVLQQIGDGSCCGCRHLTVEESSAIITSLGGTADLSGNPANPESLDGSLQWLLPFTGVWPVSPTDVNAAACPATTSTSIVLGGVSGHRYLVTMRFSGKVECKTYTDGTSDGSLWRIGGTPAGDGYNIYKLTVSSPSQTFYLNNGTSGLAGLPVQGFTRVTFSYVRSIEIDAGATVTLHGDSIDSAEISDGSLAEATISVTGVTDPPQPYAGQFINLAVVAVTRTR